MTLAQPEQQSADQPASAAPERELRGFFRFKSELTVRELSDLCRSLNKALGLTITLEEAQSAQERIQAYVQSMEGRVGEGVDDLLVLWFARRSAVQSALAASKTKGKPKLSSFEIGALFGGSGGATIMALDDLDISHKLVVIDPLDGYYGQPVDPVTGASVDPDTLTRNFKRAGARATDFQIIQGLSEDRKVIAKATQLKYVSGFIDGDHSLLGIHNDWFEYTPSIEIGGYCIVDNYDDPTAIEVTHFMDKVVLTELKDYWTPILKRGQTIVMRKDAEPPAELHERLSRYINIEAIRDNVTWLADRLATTTRQTEERRLQVRNREEKIRQIESDLKRAEAELGLAAAQAQAEAEKTFAPRLTELEKALAEKTGAMEVLNRWHADMKAEQQRARSELVAASEKSARQLKQLESALADAREQLEGLALELDEARADARKFSDERRALASELEAARAQGEAALAASRKDVEAARAEGGKSSRLAEALQQDLKTAKAKAADLLARAQIAERDAGELRGHAARLEDRLNMMEAQAVAPRILLRRLAKAIVVRTLELAGAILPAGAGRATRAAAMRVRHLPRHRPASPAPQPVAPLALPATPESHEAGPPRHDLTFFVNYTFGGQTRYLPRTEFLRHTLRAGRALRQLKGAFKGERCFVMGNGPSLNHQNLGQLRDEFTIGANYIYMNKEKMGFSPTLISFANYLVIQQRLDEILELEDSVKVLPYYLFDDFGAPKDTLIINMQHQTPEFSLDASCYTSTQSTVTYVNLQLAYYLGFDEVCLIGCDNRYIQPDRGKEGTVLTQEEDDPNHFTPAYFKGLKWQKGDMDKMEQLYARAREAFADRGSKVVDCTYNGALTIFEKGDLDTVVRQKPAPSGALIEKAKSAFRDVSRNAARFEPDTVIITVSPDLTDKFGHHYNMDAFLRARAHQAGQELVSLCSINVDRTLADHANWMVPAFSVTSWYSQLQPDVVARKRQTFESELQKGLSVAMAAFEPGTKFILYMYTGNLPLAKSLATVAAQFKNVEAHAHHFYAAMTDMENSEICAEAATQIRDIQRLGARLYLGTPDLVEYFKAKTGCKLEPLGDPSVTFSDAEVEALVASGQTPRERIDGQARVLFPPNMNIEKGYGTVLDAAEAIASSAELSKTFKPVLRVVPRDNTPATLVQRAETLRAKPGIEVLEGVLTDEAFKSATLSADIICITYTVGAFKRRMSGSLTDAIMAAKPIVATRGTYVGNHVERYGCGEVFDEGDVDSLLAALDKVRGNYGHYHKAAIAARTRHFKGRSWDCLYRLLTE
jgi:hypothetical protein